MCFQNKQDTGFEGEVLKVRKDWNSHRNQVNKERDEYGSETSIPHPKGAPPHRGLPRNPTVTKVKNVSTNLYTGSGRAKRNRMLFLIGTNKKMFITIVIETIIQIRAAGTCTYGIR